MRKGYVAKDFFKNNKDDEFHFYTKKGYKKDWLETDWPPDEVVFLTMAEYHSLLKDNSPFDNIFNKLTTGRKEGS